MEIEVLEMDSDELVWLALNGLPYEREIATTELHRRQSNADASEGDRPGMTGVPA